MDSKQVFTDNEKLIHSRSWHYAKSYGMDFDDIRGQAYLVFCEALQRFDGRSSFTTFLWHRLRTLGDFCKREKSQTRSGDISRADIPYIDNTEERLAFYQALNHLSNDGKTVVEGIVQGEFERPGYVGIGAQGEYRVKSKLAKDWGWDHFRVDGVWDEIRHWYKSIN